MKNKKGIIMGVANERSIAWGIAKQISLNGGQLAFTYQGEALKKRVEPLAKSLNSNIINCVKENNHEIHSLYRVFISIRSCKCAKERTRRSIVYRKQFYILFQHHVLFVQLES